MKIHHMSRLVKSEDLNHHGTLFAGRMAEWFVEGSFIAAATLHGEPNDIVCVKVHGFLFGKPAQKGSIIELHTMVAHVGRTSLTVYGKATLCDQEEILVDGYTTFVCVDEDGRPKPHGLAPIEGADAAEQVIIDTAAGLR